MASSVRSAGKSRSRPSCSTWYTRSGVEEIAQPHRAEVAQRDAVGEAVADELRHRLRREHLSAVCGRGHARGTVDGVAERIAVAVLDDAGVQAGAHPQGQSAGVRRVTQRKLHCDHGVQRVVRVAERREHAVAGRLDDTAAAAPDRLAQQMVVSGEGRGHALGFALPQAAAALDVGEEDRLDDGRVGHDRGSGTLLPIL